MGKVKKIRGPWKSRFLNRALCDSLGKLVSPYFSVRFISIGIVPNDITFLMIVSGIVAGVLFSLPSLIAKTFAVLLYWFWYICDCSDGEVARYTNTFSKFGRELDWVSHLSCHSLFYLAIYLSFYQEGRCNMMLLSILTIIFVSSELISRNLIVFDAYIFSDNRFEEHHNRNKVIRYIALQLFNFPTFVLFFSLFLTFDFFFKWGIAFYIYILWGSCLSLYSIKEFIRYIVYFYKN